MHKFKHSKFYLDPNTKSFDIRVDGIHYTDSSENKIFIPVENIIQFYNAFKLDYERKHPTEKFEEFANNLFNQRN